MISIKFLLRDNLPSKTLAFPVGIARRLISSLTTELKTLEKHWEELPDTLKGHHKKLAEKSKEQASQAEQKRIEGDLTYYQ